MPYTNLASVQLSLWNLLQDYGHEPAPVFREVRLDPGLMQLPGSRFPRHKVNALWKKISEIVDDPCFGLGVVSHWHPSNYGALGYAMLSSPTLRAMLRRVERYGAALSTDRFFRLREHDDVVEVVLTQSPSLEYVPAQEDGALARVMGHCRLNYQQELVPLEVTLTHSAPDCRARYEEFFQAPVRFNSRLSTISFSLETLIRILPGRDEQMTAMTDEAIVAYLIAIKEERFINQVERAILKRLPCGNITDSRVAADLFMSSRTLQRKLQAEKTTFKKIVNRVRLEVAQKYIRTGSISMTELAFLLGFSESSAFSRAFKKWCGMTPSQYRELRVIQ
jgi:AraC-like DNA-binding protein